MIHPQAIVDPKAEVAEGVEIGPWTYIGPHVHIDTGTVITSHVVVKGPCWIGKNNKIYQFATVGEDTTDMKYAGEPTRLVIGDNNVIREGVTIHRGTVQDRSETTIGNNNLIMAYAHIGHDCLLGNNIIFVNNASVAGHVVVEDWAILGGYSLVYQFCRIGTHAFSGMQTAIGKDVPAFVTVYGTPAEPRTINSEGLRRRGYNDEDISELQKAYKILYRRGLTMEAAKQELELLVKESPVVAPMLRSLQLSKRGIVR